MASERRWLAVPPQPLVLDGTSGGKIYVASTLGIKVKQIVTLRSNAQPTLKLEVKRVLSATEFLVGLKTKPLDSYLDISAYLVADSATVEADEQFRPSIPLQEHERAVYEEEPTVAKRVFIVDELGNPIDSENPLPVEATISDNAPQTRFGFRKTYTTANTEETQVLPANTKKLYVAVSNKSAKLRVSFDENGTIDAGVNNYTTIEYGNSYYREGVKLVGKTLYYQANKDDLIIEIEAWV